MKGEDSKFWLLCFIAEVIIHRRGAKILSPQMNANNANVVSVLESLIRWFELIVDRNKALPFPALCSTACNASLMQAYLFDYIND